MAAEERLYRKEGEKRALDTEESCSAQGACDGLSAAVMSAQTATASGWRSAQDGGQADQCSARVAAKVRGGGCSPFGWRSVSNSGMSLFRTSPSLSLGISLSLESTSSYQQIT